jgi:hypothetical protein
MGMSSILDVMGVVEVIGEYHYQNVADKTRGQVQDNDYHY